MVRTLCNGRNTGGQQKLRPLRYTLNLYLNFNLFFIPLIPKFYLEFLHHELL